LPARPRAPPQTGSDRAIGHASTHHKSIVTTTTETIYRKQIRPVVIHGADVMDRIFLGEADHDASLLSQLLTSGCWTTRLRLHVL
jgi:hypothetical protein